MRLIQAGDFTAYPDAGHAKGITPHDNGIAPVPGYGQGFAAADSGLGNVHRLTRSARRI